MVYRLLALDLDGTLLRHDKTVDPRDIAAIRALREDGVAITIVTGRMHSGSVEAARACGIEGLIACVEGSHLVEVAGETRSHTPIASHTVELLRDTFAEQKLSTFVFDRDAIHHERSGEPFAPYVATWSPNLRLVEDRTPWHAEPIATVAIGSEAAVAAAHAALRDHHIFSVSFPISQVPGAHAVLVRALGPTKGTALAQLCDAYGCTLAEAVAVGDWLNDVPMFEVAGRSFAMGGAPPAVASKASDLVEIAAGAGGGIAEVIRRAFRTTT